MKDQLRGCIRITAKGKNLYRFINMIHCGRIMCFEQFCRNDTFFAEIYRHDLAKVMSIAEECGIELEHRELPTLSSKLLKYRRRIGLLIGAVFAVFIIGRGLLIGNIIGIGIIALQRLTGLVKLDPSTYYVSTVPVEFNIPLFVLINIATLLISVFVLIAPSYLISHIQPAKSMRYE